MWIDAICINQKDDLEKNHQVAKMKMIFETAERVVFWLGEGNEHTSKAFKKLDIVRNLKEEEVKSMTVQDLKNMFGPGAWNALKELFESAWWDRIWVIQEVTVAKSVLVIC